MLRKTMTALAVAGLLATGSVAWAETLMGETKGAQIIEVPIVNQRIDAISGIVYSQAFERGRSVRGLKMTLYVPRTKEKKPAVLYFPGGGFWYFGRFCRRICRADGRSNQRRKNLGQG